MNTDLTRRRLMKLASAALALVPLAVQVKQAKANTNMAVRSELKYQNIPKDTMSCTTCLEFIPGKNSLDLGGCKLIPGDDEISPNGYCTRWNTM